MPKWAWPVAVLLGVALTGCHVEPARASTPEFDLDQPFQVSGGQEARNPAEKLRLTFTDLLEDSRCPTEVECFWTGQARIAISVQPEGGSATRVEFNTNPAPGQTVKEATVGRHRIELVALDPYPQTPDERIEFEDYPATLVVRTR
ncbi:hypothetical protein A5724_08150 [Mycobacterium sp. ACS1612]|uniref:hypothetical protein n=1 Tax=Mycobacterium sp. ACS1612 TaxID=1834117 RepID=UPI0007FDA435|nr:hypothetical protein [Mycobacterium sp. ACS1612]OBF39638.1 hypothetical protein A5724_08150 [Mycobacterium sp. ACS1612]